MLPSPLTPVPSSGSLPSHQAKVKEHYLSHAQTCRIWVDSHASDTRSHTTLAASQESNREFKPVTPHSPGEVSGPNTFRCSDSASSSSRTFSWRKENKGRKSFCREHFFASSDCSPITCQSSVYFNRDVSRNN